MTRQLALEVGLPDLAAFDNFHPGENAEAAAAVREAAGRRPGVLYLYGPAGTGKSHLLFAAMREARSAGRRAVYASRAAVDPARDEWLDLSGEGLTCIDDIGGRLEPAEARALFSLHERVRRAAGSLVLASRLPAAIVDWCMADLLSRVRGDLVYRLAPFTEGDLEQALRLRARARGIDLTEEVVRFVLRRYERSPQALFRLLDRIDVESLAHKRRVTIPFLRDLDRASESGGG